MLTPPRLTSATRLRLDENSTLWLMRAALVTALAMALYSVSLVLYFPEQIVRLPAALSALVVALLSLRPLHRRDGLRAIQIVVYGGIIYITISLFAGGGFSSPMMIALPMIVLLPGMLMGRRIARRLSLLAAALCTGVLVAHLAGWIRPVPPLPPVLHYAAALMALLLCWVIMRFTLHAQRQRLNEIDALHAEVASAHVAAERHLREFATLADNLPVIVARLDMDERFVWTNAAFKHASRVLTDIGAHPLLKDFCTPAQLAILEPKLAAARAGERAIFLLPGHTETLTFEATLIAERESDGALSGYLMLLSDVTEREHVQRQLHHAATRDALTDLVNRASVDKDIEKALALANYNGTMLALMLIDLDGFKPINDTWGHAAGDAVLVHVAQQMQHSVRAADSVGRIGGDEFVVLLPHVSGASAIAPLADKLLAAIGTATDWNGQTLRVGASIGIALFPEHGLRPDELHAAADQAMYAAKRAGKNRWQLALNLS